MKMELVIFPQMLSSSDGFPSGPGVDQAVGTGGSPGESESIFLYLESETLDSSPTLQSYLCPLAQPHHLCLCFPIFN